MSSVASDSDYQTISETGRPRPAWAATLSKEALFRIQLSLSSRRSSVMVLETVCRIFSGTLPQSGGTVRVGDVDPSDTKWTYQTTGVPGLLVEYKDVRDMTVFSLKLVVVELESGLCTWEGKFGTTANYQVFAEDFHTFWMPDLGQVGIEFGDLSEAERMRVLLREWLERLHTSFTLQAQQESENLSRKKRPKKVQLERQDSQPRIEKKHISTPCNFIHVSGITMTRTEECEKELQGTVRRFFRGTIAGLSRTSTLSLGSKIRSRPQRLSGASSEGNLSAPLSKLSLPNTSEVQVQTEPDTRHSESSQSGRNKKYFSLPRKKRGPQEQPAPTASSTSDPLPKSQSDASLLSSSSNPEDTTPNSRRKQMVQARVITATEDTGGQAQVDLCQRRTSLNQAPERSRLDKRKFSAPNMHYHRRDSALAPATHPGIWRQHSEIPTLHSGLTYDPENLYPPPSYPSHSGPSPLPTHSSQYPANSSQYPANSAQYPANSAQYPANSAQYPANSAQYPANSAQYPANSAQYPANSAQYPANSAQYPANSAQYPSQSVTLPGHSDLYPVNSGPQYNHSIPSQESLSTYPPKSGSSPLPVISNTYPAKSGPSPLPFDSAPSSFGTVPYTTHAPPHHPQPIPSSNHPIPYPNQSDQFVNGFIPYSNQPPPNQQSQPYIRSAQPCPPSYPAYPSYPTDSSYPTDPSYPSGPSYRPPEHGGLVPNRRGQTRVSEKRDLKRLSNSYTSFGHASSQVDV